MGFKNWIKEHSIGVIIGIMVLFILLFGMAYSGTLSPNRFLPSRSYSEAIGYDNAYAGSAYPSTSTYGYKQAIADFAPEVQERKIETTANLGTEISRGTFQTANQKLHDIVTSSAGLIINEQTREYAGAMTGSYNLRIPATKYDEAIIQLKAIGTVTSFTQNSRDVTGTYVNNDVELAAEKERLARLKQLYTDRPTLDEKLRLENAIFDQDRKVKYLEDSLKRLDQNVEYSNVQVSINEKPSSFAGMSFLAFGDLVKTFVLSLKALLYFLAFIVPWAIVIGIIWYIVHRTKHK